jgi:hypothetical protein
VGRNLKPEQKRYAGDQKHEVQLTRHDENTHQRTRQIAALTTIINAIH